MSVYTSRYHDGERYVAALVREGRTKLHLTFIDDAGVVHRAVDLAEARHLTPLAHRGHPYSVSRAVRTFRAVGRERGITQAAKDELSRAGEAA